MAIRASLVTFLGVRFSGFFSDISGGLAFECGAQGGQVRETVDVAELLARFNHAGCACRLRTSLGLSGRRASAGRSL